jgi:hypothetical protein
LKEVHINSADLGLLFTSGVRFIAGRERPLAQGHHREAVWT